MAASMRKAFLKYIGKRKWRRVKSTKNSIEKNFLIYINREKL